MPLKAVLSRNRQFDMSKFDRLEKIIQFGRKTGGKQNSLQRRCGVLRQNPDFLKLWAGQTISLIGSQVTTLALPLLILSPGLGNATADSPGKTLEIGYLLAAQAAPVLFFGLMSGAFVDRLRRKPLMIGADLGRAVLLSLIPGLALYTMLTGNQVLNIYLLVVIAFLMGVLTVLFDIAYWTFLPVIVLPRQVAEGSSKLQISGSAASFIGPGIGGWLIKSLSNLHNRVPATASSALHKQAPALAIGLDAISYLMSALFIASITTSEKSLREPAPGLNMRKEILDGLSLVWATPRLRTIVGISGTYNFFYSAFFAVFFVYAERVLGLDALKIGVSFSLGFLGSLPAAQFGKKIANRIGLGPTFIGTQILNGIGMLLITLTSRTWEPWSRVGLIAVGLVLLDFGATTYEINQITLRLAITPKSIHGRMTATIRFITWGICVTLGALTGGILGENREREALVIISIGFMLASLWVLFSPLWGRQPEPLTDTFDS
jgi:MFS family permease